VKSRLLAIVVLATAFAATPALAVMHGGQEQATPDKKSKGPHPSKWDLTLTIQYSTGSSSGACTGGSGNADFCLSGDCTCYTASGFAKGTAGKGDVELFETFDNDGEIDGPITGCGPVYGDIEILGTKDDESISFVGSDCGDPITDILSGGCQLTDALRFSVFGLASCEGNISNSHPTTFKISGEAE
jgi:hypothetical protein